MGGQIGSQYDSEVNLLHFSSQTEMGVFLRAEKKGSPHNPVTFVCQTNIAETESFLRVSLTSLEFITIKWRKNNLIDLSDYPHRYIID